MKVDARLTLVRADDSRASLARDAARWRRGRPRIGPRPAIPEPQIAIRLAGPADDRAVGWLCALDSQQPRVGGNWLLCEVAGELAAALSLDDGSVVADPFRRTVELVDLLRVRATQLRGPRRAWPALRIAAAVARQFGALRPATRKAAGSG